MILVSIVDTMGSRCLYNMCSLLLVLVEITAKELREPSMS